MNKESIIQRAIDEHNGFYNIETPLVTYNYYEFSHDALDNNPLYPTLDAYINKASYADKKQIFRQMGFDVLYLTLSGTKVMDFLKDHSNGKSLDQQYINKEKNVIIVNITDAYKNLYLVISYDDADNPLADQTIDWDALEARKRRQEKMKNLLFGKTTKH